MCPSPSSAWGFVSLRQCSKLKKSGVSVKPVVFVGFTYDLWTLSARETLPRFCRSREFGMHLYHHLYIYTYISLEATATPPCFAQRKKIGLMQCHRFLVWWTQPLHYSSLKLSIDGHSQSVALQDSDIVENSFFLCCSNFRSCASTVPEHQPQKYPELKLFRGPKQRFRVCGAPK
jgi:hypothetical protein